MASLSGCAAALVVLIMVLSTVNRATAIYVYLYALDENGDHIWALPPNQYTTIECQYSTDHTALILKLTNGTGNDIYVHDFIIDAGKIGAGYEDRVRNVRQEPKRLYIDLFVPYCHDDGKKTLEGLDSSGAFDDDYEYLPTGEMEVPEIYQDGKHIPCGSTVESSSLINIECHARNTIEAVTFEWTNCIQDGDMVSTKDPATCLFIHRVKAACDASSWSSSWTLQCTALYNDGWRRTPKRCTIYVSPKSDIVLRAKDDKGDPTDILRPDHYTTVNCSHIIEDPFMIEISSTTKGTILMYNYLSDIGKIGDDFLSFIKDVVKDGHSIAFDLFTPYCQTESGLKCEVINTEATSYSYTKNVSVGDLARPSLYIDGIHLPCGSMLSKQDYENVECFVSGITPEGILSWTSCDQQGATVTEKEDITCTFVHSAKAQCLNPTGKIECKVSNTLGSASCEILIKSSLQQNSTAV